MGYTHSVLCSANMDGRVYVWKFAEGPDEHGEQQIIANIIIAVKIEGEGEPVHPRVCWHCQKQVMFSPDSFYGNM